MTKRDKEVFQLKLGIAIIVLLFILTTGGCIYINLQPTVVDESKTSSEEEVVEDKIIADSDEEDADITAEPLIFELIEGASPTLWGNNGYFEQSYDEMYVWEADKTLAETYCTEENAMEGVYTVLGNQVYQVAIEEDESSEDLGHSHDDAEYNYYQLYGYTMMPVDSDGWMDSTSYAREEITGKRIYLFDQQWQLDLYQDNWDEGQAILNGETEAAYGTIIVNGRVVQGAEFKLVDGEYYIPLTTVAQEVDKDNFYEDVTTSSILLSVEHGTSYSLIRVPWTITSIGGAHTSSDSYFNAGNITEESGDTWSDLFRTGDTSLCYVPSSELTRYTGWSIYTDGNVVSIVSDETAVSDLFILNTQGVQSYSEQLQYSDTITITF